MQDRNGSPIGDGRRVRVLETDFQGKLVEGPFATVDFIENHPPKVAVTTDAGFELYLRPELLIVQEKSEVSNA